jgi:hypothetical protein
MTSLYDELSEKIRRDPRLTAHLGARQDLGILLFSHRDALKELWKAAALYAPLLGSPEGAELQRTVEKLKPLFGERAG